MARGGIGFTALALALSPAPAGSDGDLRLPPWPLSPDGDVVAVTGGASLSAEGGAASEIAPGLWRVVPAPGAAAAAAWWRYIHSRVR